MSPGTFLSIVLVLSAVCYLMLGTRLVTSKRDVGGTPIGVLFIVMGVWVASGAVESFADSFVAFSIGRTGHFAGTALLPIAAYVCFRDYTGVRTPRRLLLLMLVLPVASILLAATNQHHEFMWYLPNTNDAGQFLTRPAEWGPWFLFVHAPYGYSVIGIAIMTLLAHSSAVAPAQRRGLFLLTAACVPPLLATLAYDFGFGPNTVSFVALVLAIMMPIYAWLVIVEKIVEFTPLAYETVFQNMQDPVIVVDEQHRVLGLNHVAEDLLDVSESDALREPLEALFRDGSESVFEALATGQPQKLMTGTGRFLHVQVSPINSSASSARGGRVLMFRDVSDVERAQTEVRNSEQLLRSLIDHSANGILRLRWVHDEVDGRSLRCIFANAAAGRFLATDVDDLIDLDSESILRHATKDLGERDAECILERFRDAVSGNRGLDTELRQEDEDAGRWMRMVCEPVGDDFAMTFIDVTDGKVRERQMESIAWSDPLTGVLNRRGFEREASRRLSDSPDDATGALLFIDLNDFKQINDRCGHEVGDQLLTIAAQRLRTSLRSADIIGRPGGDEFVALVPDVTGQVADKLAKRLAAALDQPYGIGDEELACAASIGLALYPENASTLTGLMREADQAMYRAKARSRDVPNLRSTGLLEKAM